MFELLIASHHKMLMIEIAQQHAQMIAQQQALANEGQEDPQQGGMGTAPGTTPFTQPGQAPTGSSIRRTIGG